MRFFEHRAFPLHIGLTCTLSVVPGSKPRVASHLRHRHRHRRNKHRHDDVVIAAIRNQASVRDLSSGSNNGDDVMRILVLTVLLAGGVLAMPLSGSSAQAQNAPWCLMTGSASECDFNSMNQCLASKRGNADFCEQNTTNPANGYSGNARDLGYSRAPE
jgi:Protein of unknown function (DUF3551)